MRSPPNLKLSAWLEHGSVDCWRLTEDQVERLRLELGAGVEVVHCREADEFAAGLRTSHVAITWHCRPEWIAAAPDLEWISTPAAGRDLLQVDASCGVDLCFGTFHGKILGETVLAWMLAQGRGVLAAERLRGRDPWPRRQLAHRMRTLEGARLTVLGFGAIGEWIGKLAKPFGVQVTGVRRRRVEPPDWFGPDDRVVQPEHLDDALAETDWLVLALPGDPSTDSILSRRRIARLPPRAVVVNIGRGNSIDEAALAEALASERLAGAWLDVFQKEPLPETSPLRSLDNVFLFPHLSAAAPEYLDLYIDEFVPLFRARFADRLRAGKREHEEGER